MSSGKRQLESSGPEQAAKLPKLDSGTVLTQLKDQESVISEMETLLVEIESADEIENPDPRMNKLCKVMKLIVTSQKNLTSVVIDAAKVSESRSGASSQAAPTNSQLNTKRKGNSQAPPPPPEDPQVAATKKVKQVLRDAEKKTVLFNLNLGKNPVMNKDSLSRKVTESLSSTVRAGNHDFNITDAEEVLDDILSCSKLEFLGTQSKLFFNDRKMDDPRNNNMYTLPVRMDFKDRDTRFEAEVMLRKICKVSCSVPYPKKMRNLLSDIIKEGKTIKPDCFIRTKVDVERLTIEAHAKTASGWFDLNLKRSIPLNILDNSTLTPQVQMELGADELSQIS
jgi:hypothetical protein